MEPTRTLFDHFGVPILVTLTVMLLIVETLFPLRGRVRPRWRRVLTNAAFSLPSLALARLALIPALVALSDWNQQWHLGIVQWLHLPARAGFILGFLVLDYLLYVWHWMMHQLPFLWRFHLVHHTDRDLDVTTAVRFHFGEMLLSIPGRGTIILLSGVAPGLVLVYEICFEAATSFQHSNWRLPASVEKILNLLLVTPRMHGIHHSTIKTQRNTNYSTIFSWWDRLHGTLKMDIPQEHLHMGIQAYPEMLSILSLLLLPFKKQYEDE
jgi:sterol desaturase/sphingolipid hydroxylase (fatty acid hydroxylase superfamily)